ncbi:MAG: GlsB/YeaQ/YmgE family stress response membrane protein [Chloroflexia bacterium]
MSLSLSVDDLPRLLVMLVVAAIFGYLADLFTGGRVPLRFFGTILFGLLGAWVAVELVRPRVPFTLPREPIFDGVMLVTAALGAFVFALAWCILGSRMAGR